MRKTTGNPVAIWPTPCEACHTVVQMGGQFVVGRQGHTFCVPCWEEAHQ